MSDRFTPPAPPDGAPALRPKKQEGWPRLGDPVFPLRTRICGVRPRCGWRPTAAQGRRFKALMLVSCLTVLTACGDGRGSQAGSHDRAPDDRGFAGETLNAPPPAPVRDVVDPPAPPAAEAGPVVGTLAWAAAGAWRPPEERARDGARKPLELFAFMGVRASHAVVEAWPGGGWHAAILAPYLRAGGGRYVAATPPAPSLDAGRAVLRAGGVTQGMGAAALREALVLRFADPRLGPPPPLIDLGPTTPTPVLEPPADAVLSVNDVHVWMALGMAEKAFRDLYALVRPGGALTVVQYRAPENAPQDPSALSGYVRTSFVVRLAEEAGFTLEAQSAILENPKDDADHPFGVWTLAPFNRTSPLGEPFDPDFDRAAYDAIGEPDQMALLFRKPAGDE